MNVAVLRKKILLLSGFNIKGMKTSTIFLRFSSCCFLDGAHGFCCFWQLRRFNENIGIVCFLPHFLPAKRRNAQLVLRNTLSMGKRTTTTAKSNSFMKFSEERPKKNTRIQGRSRGLSTQQWTFLGPVFSLGSHSNNPLQPYSSSIYNTSSHSWMDPREDVTPPDLASFCTVNISQDICVVFLLFAH